MSASNINFISDSDRLAKTKLDSDVRMQSMNMTQFRPTVNPIKKFGANKGDTVAIEKWQKLSKQTSELNELRSMPINRADINEVTVTVKEYGNASGFTTKAMTLAEYSVNEKVKEQIAVNMAESIDSIIGTEFKNSDVFYTPTGAAAGTYDVDGTVSTSAGDDMESYHWRDIVRNMKSYNVPFYDGSHYLALVHVFTMGKIYEDTAAGSVVDLKKYDQPEELLTGEVGMYYGLRFVEENNVFDGGIGGQTTYQGDGVVIGADAVAEALAKPEYTVMENYDFGRFNAIGWLALTAFKKVWTHSTDSEHRIVYIHSDD